MSLQGTSGHVVDDLYANVCSRSDAMSGVLRVVIHAQSAATMLGLLGADPQLRYCASGQIAQHRRSTACQRSGKTVRRAWQQRAHRPPERSGRVYLCLALPAMQQRLPLISHAPLTQHVCPAEPATHCCGRCEAWRSTRYLGSARGTRAQTNLSAARRLSPACDLARSSRGDRQISRRSAPVPLAACSASPAHRRWLGIPGALQPGPGAARGPRILVTCIGRRRREGSSPGSWTGPGRVLRRAPRLAPPVRRRATAVSRAGLRRMCMPRPSVRKARCARRRAGAPRRQLRSGPPSPAHRARRSISRRRRCDWHSAPVPPATGRARSTGHGAKEETGGIGHFSGLLPAWPRDRHERTSWHAAR